ncbi:MAG: hypothetical protein AAF531_03745 [Actinomycetota bacterium]
MTESIELSSPADVLDALEHPDLVPPPPAAALGTGAVALLRSRMARFSSGSSHTCRRRSVESAIDRIDLARLAGHAVEETRAALAEGVVDPDGLAGRVPTRALARSLAVDHRHLAATAAAVDSIAAAIGRGMPVDGETDGRCRWLLDLLDDHPDGGVAALSLLYQNRDATAALLRSVLAAEPGGRSEPAIAGTVRVATGPVSIGSVHLDAGDPVRLRFTTPDQEFGAGPHRCPGAAMASCIVQAIRSVLDDQGIDDQ